MNESVKVVGCPHGNGPMCEGPTGARKCGLSWGCAHDALLVDLAQARAETDDLVAKAWDAAKAGIDQLTQERDQARAERDEWKREAFRISQGSEIEIDRLRAENQPLREVREVVEAARGVLNCVDGGDQVWDHQSDGGCLDILQTALAALDGQAQPQDEATPSS